MVFNLLEVLQRHLVDVQIQGVILFAGRILEREYAVNRNLV